MFNVSIYAKDIYSSNSEVYEYEGVLKHFSEVASYDVVIVDGITGVIWGSEKYFLFENLVEDEVNALINACVERFWNYKIQDIK